MMCTGALVWAVVALGFGFNIWHGGPDELHQSVHVLLHFMQFSFSIIDIEFSFMLMCFARKVCGPLSSTWGASLGEGKPGVKVGIQNNTKAAGWACSGQTLPLCCTMARTTAEYLLHGKHTVSQHSQSGTCTCMSMCVGAGRIMVVGGYGTEPAAVGH